MPAQLLAQTRPGAAGAVFAHSAVHPQTFGGPWPAGVPLQIHMAEQDPEALPPHDDLEAARALAAAGAELYLYPGDAHLFTDRTLPDYDEPAATQLTDRVLALLTRLV